MEFRPKRRNGDLTMESRQPRCLHVDFEDKSMGRESLQATMMPIEISAQDQSSIS
jgi:hypothetical protein